MKVYLVAQAWFKQLIRIYLAGSVESLTSDMKIFLAESGGLWEAYFSEKDFAHAYILQSFYYADEFTEKYIIPNANDFLLDSGAFSFMEGKGHVDWNDYAKRYAAFVNKNDIKKYIELDLDYIIGVDGARELRRYLEKETGKKSIPVWHPIRGVDEFKRMCDDYPYVCLGGIVGQKWRGMEQFMPWFINEAHKRGTKIHGLGFTKLSKLPDYHFDSVDSTAWTAGNRFGFVYQFKNGTMQKVSVPKGKRLGDVKKVALINYIEWVKFQKWADVHL